MSLYNLLDSVGEKEYKSMSLPLYSLVWSLAHFRCIKIIKWIICYVVVIWKKTKLKSCGALKDYILDINDNALFQYERDDK